MIKQVQVQTNNAYKTATTTDLSDGLAKITLIESENKSELTTPNAHEIDDDDDDSQDDDDIDDDGAAGDTDEFRCVPPSDFDVNRMYDMQFVQRRMLKARQEPEKKFKNGTRMSMHFTNDRMREIDRCNKILLRKILNSGPSHVPKSAGQSPKSMASTPAASRVTSATLNRRKQQQRIDRDNEFLLKKLQNIQRNK